MTFYGHHLWQGKDLTTVDEMMDTGMTHAGITFRPDSLAEDGLQYLENQGYTLALGITAGHYTWGGLDELVPGNDDSKFLDAPCLDCNLCDYWNAFDAANDPTYTGILWQNTLANTTDVVSRANADLVFYDVEIWYDPTVLEWYYNGGDPGQDCNCNVVDEGIGYTAYRDAWMQRGLELRDIVHNNDANSSVYFYQELPLNAIEWIPNYQGTLVSRTEGYMQYGSGDFANPSLYILPNLDALEQNITDMDFTDLVTWLSFTYVYGYSNYNAGDLYFDTSVSYLAGVMLRQAGAKGFIIYPNADDERETFPIAEYGNYNGYEDENGYGGYQYWLNHAEALVQGFNDGETYTETNKIKNPSLEAFKPKADSYNGALVGVRFIPNFWSWTDTDGNADDTATYANLVAENVTAGVYKWRHTRTGTIGVRTITSSEFEITALEEGTYTFSISAQTSVSDANSNLSFEVYNVGLGTSETIGDVSFDTLLNGYNYQNSISLAEGSYELKIILNDNTGQSVDIYLDDVSLHLTP